MLITLLLMLKPTRMRKALIIATKDQLIDESLFSFFQKGNIVNVVNYNKGTDYCFCKTLDDSKSVAILKQLVIAEDSFMKIVDKPRLSPINRSYHGRVISISKIITENTVRIQLPNGCYVNANVIDLKHV